ncbi:MAG: FAD-dependent oxidoreductase [Verrucomicrobia bacterium]|jgi:all-trans-retinol 13,14-reductase|nr:FAD-dependent oxidoreductase [Verrucomicrobiota bacterium]MDA0904865.1 FAD-dependent oxidoreductase [Verrucomicrobiota bacterium]
MSSQRDHLKGIKDYYDVVVVGSGLGGLTGANCLAKQGHSVLLLEHHYQFGGLATWFKRAGGHIFDISLHGFPVGMIKSCRRYWTKEIADSIVQLKGIRFVNPQYDLNTTFDRFDFTRILQEKFKIAKGRIEEFYDHLKNMDYFAKDGRTIGDLLEEFFPGRDDVKRLLLEPISYANGSSFMDPAIAYGIVFTNFMRKGIYTFKDGTDSLVRKMVNELRKNGVELRRQCNVDKIVTQERMGKPCVTGVKVNGKEIRCGAVLSNANLKNTIEKMLGMDKLPSSFAKKSKDVRLNSTSCQVYIGLKKGEVLPESLGDLIFTSESPKFSTDELADFHTTSRTFSIYYPDTRPHRKEPRYSIVASLNAKWKDWANLSECEYSKAKQRLCEESIIALEKIVPDIRTKIEHIEAATPRTIKHYTQHANGATFGTKFEGLEVSNDLPTHAPGLFHAGSVGIIMSGWLGTINYGVITANKIDSFLRGGQSGDPEDSSDASFAVA